MKRAILVVVSLAILGSLIGWRLKINKRTYAQETASRAARRTAPANVNVAEAAVRDIVSTFAGIGTVEAPLTVRIAPKVTGRIDFVGVREGDQVTAGETLVRIDPTDVRAEVAQKLATLAEARARLAQAGLTTEPTDVLVTTNIRQMLAGLQSAEADASQTTENYASQVAAAQAAVVDAQGRVSSANAAVANAKASLNSAQANLDNGRAKYARILDLYKQGYIAAQDVDDAKTAVSIQEAGIDVASGQIDAAKASLQSAQSQKESAQKQADIVVTKGKADIAASKAKVTQAQAALEYARANSAQKPAYRQNLAALRSTVAAAEADLAVSQSHLADTTLICPVSGSVIARYMDPGTVATPGQAILAVQAIKQVWITVPIPEEVSRKIHDRQLASVTFDALPGIVEHGIVTQVVQAVDPESRQFNVRVTLDNPTGQLKPGMFARVEFETSRFKGSVTVPPEAIRQSPGGPFVYVVSADNAVERHAVTLGPSDPSSVAVSSGVSVGDKVVVLSSGQLKDGQSVRVGGTGRGARGGSQKAGPNVGYGTGVRQ